MRKSMRMEFVVFDYGEDNLLDTEVRLNKDSSKSVLLTIHMIGDQLFIHISF